VKLFEELSTPIIHRSDPRVTVPRATPSVTPRTAQAGKNKKKRDRRRAKQLLARRAAADAAPIKTPNAVDDIAEVPTLLEVTP
jgi:hypothetical protein